MQRHRVATKGVCVSSAPDVSTAYIICRAQWRMKMQGHLFKNHFKMTVEYWTRHGVLLSVHESNPARSTRPRWSQLEVQQGQGWGRGLLGRHSVKSVFTTYWILPSVTDMPFQWHPSWLCLATTNYAWVVYELKHYHYFQILWGSSERFEIHSHNLKKCQQWNCQWKKRKNCYILSIWPYCCQNQNGFKNMILKI